LHERRNDLHYSKESNDNEDKVPKGHVQLTSYVTETEPPAELVREASSAVPYTNYQSRWAKIGDIEINLNPTQPLLDDSKRKGNHTFNCHCLKGIDW
jgi:hypothetical protein